MENRDIQRHSLFLAVILLLVRSVVAQPPITNYSSSDYRAHSQNWQLSQSADYIMYAANSDGLLEYDGATWRLFPLPNGQIVRSVLCDQPTGQNPRVYVGGYGEFGYWENIPTGKMAYQSLSQNSGFKSAETEEIWHILKTRDAVYFQSFSRLYKYDGRDISEIKVPGNFMFLREVHGRLLIQLITKGLYELRGNAFIPVAETEKLSGTSVTSLLPFAQDKVLIATKKDGLFVLEKDKMTRWPIAITSDLNKNIINRAIQLKNGNYVLGTILN